MTVIQPYDLTQYTIEELEASKKILNSIDNKVYRSSIFPDATPLNILSGTDSRRIVTQIDTNIFKDFIVLTKDVQKIYNSDKTKQEIIRAVEYGDFNNSVKRYTNLDYPVDINKEANKFLNLPKIDFNNKNLTNVTGTFIHNPEVKIEDFGPKTKPSLFDPEINHPHINSNKLLEQNFKFNNKDVIEEVLKWAKDQGITYIYCIIEYRPYCINYSYTTPYVYYTVKGAKGTNYANFTKSLSNARGVVDTNNIIDEFPNDLFTENGNNLVWK